MPIPQQFISESCSWFHTEDNYAQALVMESLSGIGLNRLGLFKQCLKDPTLRYFLMKYVLNSTGNTYYTGICYSSNCSASDLRYIAKSVNEYVPLPFNSYKIFEPHQSEHIWNTYLIVFTAIFSIFLIPVLITTIVHCFKYKKNGSFGQKFIQFFSLQSSISFLFQKVSSNQKIKVLSGMRSLAFLGMTLFTLTVSLSQIPSTPEAPLIQKHLLHFYYSYDIWLMTSGFHLSFELCRQWSKQKSIKQVWRTFFRKMLKILVISAIVLLWISYVIYGSLSGPLWTLTLDYFQTQCKVTALGKCNYGLWLWQIQIIMCFLCCLLFLLYQSKIKYNKILYSILNIILFLSSFLIAFFFGFKNKYGRLQEGVSNCPIVMGISYLLGFNLGILYFWFRANKHKYKLSIMQVLKYQSFRVFISMLTLATLTFVYLYFLLLQNKVPQRVNQFIYQLFHLIVPMSYALLILPQILGFQNVVGAIFRDKFMSIVSKLSFCSFTFFQFVALLITNSRKQDLYVNTAKVLCLWVCSLAISMLYGFILCVIAQLPVYRLLFGWLGQNSPRAYIQHY